jgi:hypothetical protein
MMALAMQVEKRENFAPATAARLYAYAASIYADALAKTSDATTSAATTALLLEDLSPHDQTFIDISFTNIFNTEPFLDADTAQLLTVYEARAKADHFSLKWSPSMIPAGPDYWYVRDGKADGGAMAGQWTPWILATSSAVAPPPPARGSIDDSLELAKVQYAVNNRRIEDLPSIYFWQGASGFTKGVNHDNISPAGVWQNVLSVEEGSRLSDAEYAQAQKILAQSIADSFIYTWQVKYTYYTQRPSMRIKDLNIAIGDPPFPSYMSGHSTISATAAVVLSALFPDKQTVWFANYHDARYSRLDAGIHYDVDNAAGYHFGSQLGDEIVTALGIDHVVPLASPYRPTNSLLGAYELASLDVANYVYSLHLPTILKNAWGSFAHLFARRASGAANKIKFTDVTAAAGLDYLQSTLTDPMHCLAPSPLKPGGNCELNHMAGGVTVGDFNHDGWPDLFVTRIGGPGILYENMHDGTFKDVTSESGIDTAGFNTNGALFVDLDNDGWPDLYLTTIGAKRNLLFMNNGAGHFTEEGVARGVALDNGTTHTGESVSAGDYNGDGYLDLFVDEWRPSDIADVSSTHSVLLRNRGDMSPGFFADVTAAAGLNLKSLSDFGVYTISSTFADLDNDGWPDLAITSDFGTSQLYWNNGDGTFSSGTKHAGVSTEENGMGSAIGDYNGDGLLDWFVSSIYTPDPPCKGSLPDCPVGWSGNRLYENNGDRTFSDVTDKAGVRDGGWGWGASWLDADNSGRLDLVMANGFKFGPDDPPVVKSLKGFETAPLRFWYNNGDGSMSEVAGHAGLTDTNRSTGLATLDFNNDGRTDLVVIDNEGKPHLYRNDSDTTNGWLKVQVLTAKDGRDALGAVIKVQTVASSTEQTRQVGVNGSFLGQSENIATFGLGAGTAPVARVTVEWPWLSKTKTYTNVARDTTLVAVPD